MRKGGAGSIIVAEMTNVTSAADYGAPAGLVATR
jgi:hypothetical protein